MVKIGRLDGYEKERKIALLKQLMLKLPLVHSLAHIPINLTILCSIFHTNDEQFIGEVSLTITALYSQIIDQFYKIFLLRNSRSKDEVQQLTRPGLDPSITNIAKSLEEIAIYAMRQGTLYVRQEKIEEIITSKRVGLDLMRDLGLFKIELRRGQFIHLTFQEYFAATYLARLYLEGDVLEGDVKAQRLIARYKFNPRFKNTLKMTAGYLSNEALIDEEKKKALIQFFEDLDSAPLDCATIYKLLLLAECFEECHDPQGLNGYTKFIRDCVNYIQSAQSASVVFDLLFRNTKLFNHVDIQKCIRNYSIDQNRSINMQSLLSRIHSQQQVSALSSHEILPHRLAVTDPLEEQINHLEDAFNREPLPLEAIETLLRRSRARPLDLYDRTTGIPEIPEIVVLGKISQRGQKYSSEATRALVTIAASSGFDWYKKERAAIILGQIIQVSSTSFADVIGALVAMIEFGTKQGIESIKALEIIGQIIEKRDEYSSLFFTALVEVVRNLSKLPDSFRMAHNFTHNLRELAKGPHANLAANVLINIVETTDIGWKFKSPVVCELAEIIKEKRIHSDRILDTLFGKIGSFLTDESGKWAVVTCLKILGESDVVIPSSAIDGLAVVMNDPTDDFRREMAADAITKIAKNGGREISTIIFDALVGMIKDGSQYINSWAGCALLDVSKSESIIPPDTIHSLLTIIETPHLSSPAEKIISDAIIEIAKKKENISLCSIQSLIRIVGTPELSPSVRFTASWALIEIAKRPEYYRLASDTVDPLISLITGKNRQLSKKAKCALIALARNNASISSDQVWRLMEIIKQTSDEYSQRVARVIFVKMIKVRQDILVDSVLILENVLKESPLSIAGIIAALGLGLMGQNNVDISCRGIISIVGAIVDPNIDTKLKSIALNALYVMTKIGIVIPAEHIIPLVDIASNLECRLRNFLAYVFVVIGRGEGEMHSRGITTLLSIVKNEQGSTIDRHGSICLLKKLATKARDRSRVAAIDALKEIALSPLDDTVCTGAISAIEEIAEKREIVPSKCVKELVVCLKDPDLNFMMRETVVSALCTIGKGEESCINAFIHALNGIICNREMSIVLRKRSVSILHVVTHQVKNLPIETISALVSLTYEKEFLDSSEPIMQILELMGIRDGSVAGVEGLLAVIRNSGLNKDFRSQAFKALRNIAIEGEAMMTQKVFDALGDLTRLQQQAFILEENETAHSMMDAILSGRNFDAATKSTLDAILADDNLDEQSKEQKVATELKISLERMHQFIENIEIRNIATGLLITIYLRKTVSVSRDLLSPNFIDTVVVSPDFVDALYDFCNRSVLHPHDGETYISLLRLLGLKKAELSDKVMDVLIKIIGNSKLSGRLRYDAVYGLQDMIKNGVALSATAMNALIDIIKMPTRFISYDSPIDELARLLGAIANFDHTNGVQALEMLSDVARSHRDWVGIVPIFSDIGAPRLLELIKEGASCNLVLEICYLTGKAFFLSDPKIFISDSHEQAEMLCPPGIETLQPIDLFSAIPQTIPLVSSSRDP
ncbi:MAG: hypothetical protein ACHQUC_06210 [Chlamydiales bacterium]